MRWTTDTPPSMPVNGRHNPRIPTVWAVLAEMIEQSDDECKQASAGRVLARYVREASERPA